MTKRICPQCGKEFVPTQRNQKYDSAECRRRAFEMRRSRRRERTLERKLYKRRMNRRHYQLRRQRGLCVRCGHELLDSEFVTCVECREENQIRKN